VTVYETAQKSNQLERSGENVNHPFVLIGYGRMPNDPPGGNAWLEVWASRHARSHTNAGPLETVKLGWANPVKSTVELAKGWLAARPDLADADLGIAGGNARSLSLG
jgi:hypothetical protein